MKSILFFVSEDWYFCSHRIELAKAAIKNGYSVSIITRVNNHREEIIREGIKLIDMNIERGNLNVFSDIKVLFRLIKIVRKEKPNLIHNVAMKPVIYGSIASFFVKNIKIVNALGGLGFIFSSKSLKAMVLKPIIKRVFKLILNRKDSFLIVQNKDDLNFFIEGSYLGFNHISLIRGAGVDSSLYKIQPEPDGKIVATLLARMLIDKGVHEFIEAANILKERSRDIKLVLVGDPDPINPASIKIEFLRALNQTGVVEWKGFEKDISGVWKKSHISVLPSYREGLPKSLLESFACGRPIITTNVPGCREIVTDGVNGLLVPVKDSLALANAIEKLALDSSLRLKFGLEGRKLIDQELSSDKIHQTTLELYRKILS